MTVSETLPHGHTCIFYLHGRLDLQQLKLAKAVRVMFFFFSLFFWKYHNLKKNNNTFLKYLPMFYVRLYYTFVCIYFLFNRRKQTYFILLRTSFSVADFSVNEVWCSPYFTTHRLSHCNPMCSVLDDITPPERLVKPSTPPAMTFCMHGEHARRHAAN